MRRRDVLTIAGTGAVASLAGCTLPFTGGSDDDENGGGGGGNGETQPEISEAVELVDAEIVRSDEGTFAEQVRVDGNAKNTADVELTAVQAKVRFLDENGEELDSRTTDSRSIGAGKSFSFSVRFPATGSEASAVQDYEVEFGQYEEADGDGEE